MDEVKGKGAVPGAAEVKEAIAIVPSLPVVPLISTQPVVPVITPPLTYSQKVLIAVGLSAAAVLLILFIYTIAHVIVLCFAGLLLAVFLSAPSDLLVKYTGIGRGYALLIVLAALLIVVSSGIYFMGYTVYRQTQQLSRTLQGASTQLEHDVANLLPDEPSEPEPSATSHPAFTQAATTDVATPPLAIAPATMPDSTQPAATLEVVATTAKKDSPRQWAVERLTQIRESATDFLMSESFVKGAGGVAGGVVSSTFGVIGDIAVVIGVGLFFAIHPSLYAQGLVRLLPIPRRKRAALILSQVGTQLQWWFVGQLCSMFSIGIVTFIGLKLLGVPMAVTLAMLAGLMNFVPNFGPLIAAAPAVVLAFAPNGDQTELRPALAGWVIVMYIVVQLLEGWVITPFFQQRAVELPPALIIISQVVFALFFGPIGLILATPILAATIVLVRMIYVEDILGDSTAATRKQS